MNNCAVCNKKECETREAIFEGVLVKACSNCISLGKAVEIKPKEIEEKIMELQKQEENEMIVPDFSSRIKNARLKLNWTEEDLANKMYDRIITVRSLESNKTIPTFRMAKNLERLLSIKLIDTFKAYYVNPETHKPSLNLKDGTLKIADLLNIKEKRKV